jgi:hypothetical protein
MGRLSSSANLKRLAFSRGVRVKDKCRFFRRIWLSMGNVGAHEDELRYRYANYGVILLHLSQVARKLYRPLFGAGAD